MKTKKKKIKLPKEFRTKWLDMLTSGRYKQAEGTLRDGEKYCCLGVAGRAVGIKRKDLRGGFPSDLSNEFAKKYPSCLLRLEKEGGEIVDKENTALARDLANMNDEGKTFKEIAAYIKSNTIGV